MRQQRQPIVEALGLDRWPCLTRRQTATLGPYAQKNCHSDQGGGRCLITVPPVFSAHCAGRDFVLMFRDVERGM
jgi:hypothetical protein